MLNTRRPDRLPHQVPLNDAHWELDDKASNNKASDIAGMQTGN